MFITIVHLCCAEHHIEEILKSVDRLPETHTEYQGLKHTNTHTHTK